MQNLLFLGIIAQLALLLAGGALYLRMRSHADAETKDRIQWGIKVEGAVGVADSAKRAVETIELEHYKRLRALYEAQAMEIGSLNRRIADLEGSLKACNDKLATRIATEKRYERKARQEEAEEAASAQPGTEPALNAALKNGTAIPLFPPGDASPRPIRKFGQIP